MRRILALGFLPLMLAACQGDDSVRRDITMLQKQQDALRAENDQLRADLDSQKPVVVAPGDDSLKLRLERTEVALDAANREIAALKEAMASRPVAERAAPVDLSAKIREEMDRQRVERDTERRREQTERMAEMTRIAREAGLEIDPNDMEGSVRRIMRDPEQRAKAMQVMRTEIDKRRFERLGFDERKTAEVKRIESDTLTRIQEITQRGRETGASNEQIRSEVDQARKDAEGELKTTLTEEEFKRYQESLPGMLPGMIPGMGDWGGMFPGNR